MGTQRPSDPYHFTRVSADVMTVPDNSVGNAAIKSAAEISVEKLELATLSVYPLSLSEARVWDALSTPIPTATAANDDCHLITGTLGSSEAPLIKTEDKASNGGVETQSFAYVANIPHEYADGETFEIRVAAKMAAAADVSATVDVRAFLLGRDGTIGADICATAAQSINATSYADKDFTITPTTLEKGLQLLTIVDIAIRDNATGSGIVGTVAAVELLCDTRG